MGRSIVPLSVWLKSYWDYLIALWKKWLIRMIFYSRVSGAITKSMCSSILLCLVYPSFKDYYPIHTFFSTELVRKLSFSSIIYCSWFSYRLTFLAVIRIEVISPDFFFPFPENFVFFTNFILFVLLLLLLLLLCLFFF